MISYFVEGTGLWVFSSCSVSLLVWIDFGLYLSVLRIMIVNLLVLSVFAKEVSQSVTKSLLAFGATVRYLRLGGCILSSVEYYGVQISWHSGDITLSSFKRPSIVIWRRADVYGSLKRPTANAAWQHGKHQIICDI